MGNIAHLQEALPGFFNFTELEASGPRELTIATAGIEKIGQGDRQEEKPILGFLGTRKKLVLNATRCKQLAEIFGSNTDPVGKKVRLVAAPNFKVNGRGFDMVILEACGQ